MRVLVTSQEPLKVYEETVYRLDTLAIPSSLGLDEAQKSGAVQLFVSRAQAADPRFALTADNADAVAEICKRLDGIPLALELAAARLPLLGVEGLRARLDERLQILTGGSRFVLRRHQTLRAALDFSHGLLSPDEQAVFRRTGVFAGSFALESAQDVVADEKVDSWATLDHLGTLVDKSILIAVGSIQPRLRLLETTRAYALEKSWPMQARRRKCWSVTRMRRRGCSRAHTRSTGTCPTTRGWRATSPSSTTCAPRSPGVLRTEPGGGHRPGRRFTPALAPTRTAAGGKELLRGGACAGKRRHAATRRQAACGRPGHRCLPTHVRWNRVTPRRGRWNCCANAGDPAVARGGIDGARHEVTAGQAADGRARRVAALEQARMASPHAFASAQLPARRFTLTRADMPRPGTSLNWRARSPPPAARRGSEPGIAGERCRIGTDHRRGRFRGRRSPRRGESAGAARQVLQHVRGRDSGHRAALQGLIRLVPTGVGAGGAADRPVWHRVPLRGDCRSTRRA